MSENFKLRVWNVCKRVPVGKVCAYSQIAKALGNPKASRAVGNALNKSPGMPYVPCHRIVKSNGEIGGFAFGEKKKISLLKKEGVKIENGLVAVTSFYKFENP